MQYGGLMKSRFALGLMTLCLMLTAVAAQDGGKPVVRLRTVAALVKDGWWLRVDTASTKAQSIQFTFGTNPKNEAGKESWTPKNPPDFAVTDSIRTQKMLNVRASAAPTDAPAAVCVFFQQQGVARLQFTGSESRQLNANQKDATCAP